MAGMDVVFISCDSYDFPQKLREYRYCPTGLYVTPPVSLNMRFIAVVGARECSAWGREVAWESGSIIASEGFTLVTGLASGVDVSASLGALETGGLVVGVRPWLKPLNLPSEAREVLRYHYGRVVITSEHYIRPTAKVETLYFLRNRLIAGMAELVVVVEAKPGGGSMHQITWTLKQGKPLAIYKHINERSTYYRAYEEFIKHKGVIILKDVDDLRRYIEEELKPSF